jgi:hypothetical protein
MARRTLSMQGRILAAGVSVAVGGALIGVMAASDGSAGASSNNNPAVTSPSSSDAGSGSSATPYDGGSSSNGSSDNGFGNVPGDNSGFQPQPQTRTGGS